MPLVLADRIKETTTTTGTGSVTLLGAVIGFQSFAVIGDGNTTYYTIAGQGTNEWEVGVGTYTASGTTLSRDTVLASSAGAPTKTNFSGGTKDVFVTYPAERAVYSDGTNIVPDTAAVLPPSSGGTGANTLTANNVILGNGTSAVQFVAPGASNNVLVSNGTTWVSGGVSLPNSVTFNNGGVGDASGTTYNGSAARTISYNTVGAPSTTGANASGTWSINVTGSAGSAGTANFATSAGSATTAGFTSVFTTTSTAVRTLGVTYTNTSGRVLGLYVAARNGSGVSTGMTYLVNGVVGNYATYTPGTANFWSGSSIMVPAGATYRVNNATGFSLAAIVFTEVT